MRRGRRSNEIHPRPRLARHFEAWRDWWFAYVSDFDPETGGARYWRLRSDWPAYAPFPSATTAAAALEQVFVRAGELVERYGRERVATGLWYIAQPLTVKYSHALWDESSDEAAATAAIRAMYSLYRDLFAQHCVEAASAGPASAANPLNDTCYMWFDLIGLDHLDKRPLPGRRLAVAVETLGRILAIPHIACQESAIHGLGHVAQADPAMARPALDRILRGGQGVPSELRAFAEAAREGRML